MKHLLIALLLSVTVGCASFDKRAEWPDSAYGGALNKVAHELYLQTHDPYKTSLIGSRTMADMHINPKPLVICTTHTSMAMKELNDRGMKYEVLLLKENDWLWHSVVKVGNEVIDINESEPYDYKDNYVGRYIEERNLGQVSQKEFGREVLLVSFK